MKMLRETHGVADVELFPIRDSQHQAHVRIAEADISRKLAGFVVTTGRDTRSNIYRIEMTLSPELFRALSSPRLF
jgi:hypothetical protein